MNLAYTMQKFQDWFTQQWVILTGQKFNPTDENWLIGPFGELNGIGEEFISQLAEKENLFIQKNPKSKGLLSSIKELNLSDDELQNLSQKVIDFYEKTSNYELVFDVKWNLFFKPFGFIINRLFSKRINQLNIPLQNNNLEKLSSEIIQLLDKNTNKVKYTIWLRKVENTGQVIYSGIYGTCKLLSNQTCIKAIFPLPKGNATVIMKPSVGKNRELILDSSGKKFGDAGFYFLLTDTNNNYWAKFASSFTDKLIIRENGENLVATQTLKLWNLKVSEFKYKINYTQHGIAKSLVESPTFNFSATIPQKPFFICFEKCKLANKKMVLLTAVQISAFSLRFPHLWQYLLRWLKFATALSRRTRCSLFRASKAGATKL